MDVCQSTASALVAAMIVLHCLLACCLCQSMPEATQLVCLLEEFASMLCRKITAVWWLLRCHNYDLDSPLDRETGLDIFKVDPDYEKHEAEYKASPLLRIAWFAAVSCEICAVVGCSTHACLCSTPLCLTRLLNDVSPSTYVQADNTFAGI